MPCGSAASDSHADYRPVPYRTPDVDIDAADAASTS